MNIAFFLIPKSETIYMNTESSVRQTLERMEHHSYSAIPLVNAAGHYAGTITEGDLLWFLKQRHFPNVFDLEDYPIKNVPRSFVNTSVSVYADINELLSLVINQNFVPITDDQGVFIGIVTRKTILEYLIDLKTNYHSSASSNSKAAPN